MVRQSAAGNARPAAWRSRHLAGRRCRRAGRMTLPPEPAKATAQHAPRPPHASYAATPPNPDTSDVGTRAWPWDGCGRSQPAARPPDPTDPQPPRPKTTTRPHGSHRGCLVACSRAAPLAAELAITWLGSDPDASDADSAAALQAAQGRTLRKVLAAIAAQRRPPQSPPPTRTAPQR